MAAAFAVPGSILDGMAPHVWHGPTATQDWYRDVLIEGGQHGAKGYVVTLGEPLHNNITGDRAYVVVPASMTFEIHGKQISQAAHSLRLPFASLPTGGASRPGVGEGETIARSAVSAREYRAAESGFMPRHVPGRTAG